VTGPRRSRTSRPAGLRGGPRSAPASRSGTASTAAWRGYTSPRMFRLKRGWGSRAADPARCSEAMVAWGSGARCASAQPTQHWHTHRDNPHDPSWLDFHPVDPSSSKGRGPIGEIRTVASCEHLADILGLGSSLGSSRTFESASTILNITVSDATGEPSNLQRVLRHAGQV
jgi:hypothetical protein